jgi:hypothetical protein
VYNGAIKSFDKLITEGERIVARAKWLEEQIANMTEEEWKEDLKRHMENCNDLSCACKH